MTIEKYRRAQRATVILFSLMIVSGLVSWPVEWIYGARSTASNWAGLITLILVTATVIVGSATYLAGSVLRHRGEL